MKIVFKTSLLFATLCAAAFFLMQGLYPYVILLLPVVVWMIISIYKSQTRVLKELEQCAESIVYLDFSKQWNEEGMPREIRTIRRYFNRITGSIKRLSLEKEMQYQYLQKVLEMIDTGILCYRIQTGELLWMNESAKKILHIPFLQSFWSLKKRNPTLFADLEKLKSGVPVVINLTHEGISQKMLTSTAHFIIDNHSYRLIALQNVSGTLNEHEVEAWQKLLSVMTHEIMNSVAPISSLADTLKRHLDKEPPPEPNRQEWLQDLRTGIETIGRRSKGLLRFAKTYRNLKKIGEPIPETLLLAPFLKNLHHLLASTLLQKGIRLSITQHDPTLSLVADPNLMEQLLINLLTNAVEAVQGGKDPHIKLSAQLNNEQKVQIQVIDNGQGIPPDTLDRIFIPFFSSRSGGNGIGLSLCQQIMLMHKGTIYVQSEVGKGSVFTLQF